MFQPIPELKDSREDSVFLWGARQTGKSTRKLKRSGVNLLGGRAVRNTLFLFVSKEIPDFDLDRALSNGMLPRHYSAKNPTRRIQAYVGDYLQQEIRAEALTRNLSTFGRFMEEAALSCGEMLNYNNIARECGVSAPTVKEYFSILEDTLVGYYIQAYRKVVKRRLIHAPRFYYFDLGVSNFLLRRGTLQRGSPEYGKAFEQFIIQEMYAWNSYTSRPHALTYWRTASGFEVDLILGDAEVAIEIKSVREIHSHHLKGMKAFSEEHPAARMIVVCLEETKRIHGSIEIFPVSEFLRALWGGEIY